MIRREDLVVGARVSYAAGLDTYTGTVVEIIPAKVVIIQYDHLPKPFQHMNSQFLLLKLTLLPSANLYDLDPIT